MVGRPVIVIAALLFLGLAGLGGTSPADQYTPVAMSVLAVPSPVKGTDGWFHLAYELLLVNAGTTNARVERIEALRPGTLRALRVLSGVKVESAVKVLGSNEPAAALAPGQMGYVNMDVTFRMPREVPGALVHRIVFVPERPTQGLVPPPRVVQTGAAIRVDRRPPIILGPPLRAGRNLLNHWPLTPWDPRRVLELVV